VIKRALAKEPEQRFQTARDLKAALSWALENAPAPAGGSVSRKRIAAGALPCGAPRATLIIL
jgi:hypothetical protein